MYLLASFHRKQVGPLEVLTQSNFIRVCRMRRTWPCFDHIPLILTQNHASFFFMDSFFSMEYSVTISKNFSTNSIGPSKF